MQLNGWLIGDSSLNEIQAIEFIGKFKKRSARTVVLCEVRASEPVAKVAQVWRLAQDLGYKFVLQPSPK